ncbi:hypothetical protein CAPTEDRAFT_130558 [Capitella teleta]|uniref:Cytochrome P450 n=1 Tax=Capitella teleta TaxID=283909 RepID=R7UNP7_CAPTE|nr:hypothetical protein CAPTEDRAFT_130558 [Capitella teleta]|eukprot:ELU08149.1 hypothetical protein CAPTEDRAFT_130558 [Capitella teleta]
MDEAEIPIWTILTLILAMILSIYATRKFGAFSAMGIKGPTPLPFLGNYHQMRAKGVLETDIECMKRYGRTYVYFHRSTPWLIVGDVSMIREIQVMSKSINQPKLR